jgi:hypothetical protein
LAAGEEGRLAIRYFHSNWNWTYSFDAGYLERRWLQKKTVLNVGNAQGKKDDSAVLMGLNAAVLISDYETH